MLFFSPVGTDSEYNVNEDRHMSIPCWRTLFQKCMKVEYGKGFAGYRTTRFNTFLLGPTRRGETSFFFKEKKIRSFRCWIKDFRRRKTRKLTQVCRLIPKSTLLRSMNNVRTRRSRVFQFKFAYAYISSYAPPAFPHFITADSVDWARELLQLPLLSFVESQLDSDFINGSHTK